MRIGIDLGWRENEGEPIGLMRSSRGQRARALAVATIFIASQVAVIAHDLVISHAICPEHGEIIHAGHGSPTAWDAREVHTGVAVRSAPIGVHSHDVCLIILHGRARAVAAKLSDSLEAPPALISHARAGGRLFYAFKAIF